MKQTSIEKCLEHWTDVQKSRKEEIQETIKMLDEICQKNPFDYSMFENRMYDLRRLRLDVERIDWFITSMEYHKTLDKTWIETASNCSQPVTDNHVLEISDEEIEKEASRILWQEARETFKMGGKWYREKLKNADKKS